MGFNGFPKDTRVFLRELAANNQREWFEANKKRFETVGKAPLSDLCLAVADLGAREDLDISGDPKRSPFRIYRDVRFSKDKSPYKTHLSAFFGPNGDKKELGGVYFHVEPERCLLAAGLYATDTKMLTAIRTWIVAHPKKFLAMRDDLAAKGLELESWDSLKKVPPAFAEHKDSAVAPYLTWKQFMVSRNLPPDTVESHGLIDAIEAMARDSQAFRRWTKEFAAYSAGRRG